MSRACQTKGLGRARCWLRRIAIGLVFALALFLAGFVGWTADYYHAGSLSSALVTAGEVRTDDGGTIAVDDRDSYIAVGDASSRYGVVLYPGAKVDPVAYVPLALEFAERGVFCVVAKMPFNLAVFNINAADAIVAAYPGVGHWWLVGHSLGGAIAGLYAEGGTDGIEGVAFLGAYGSEKLAASGLAIRAIYGDRDGVVKRGLLEGFIDCLPESDVYVISGGNHSGFGDYGSQPNDGVATIAASEQQGRAADIIVAAMTGSDGLDGLTK